MTERYRPERKLEPYFGIGIVLVNGVCLKDGVEIPDREGFVRLARAIVDLKNGVLRKIIITGGKLPNASRPLGEIYCEYAQKLCQRYFDTSTLLPGQIEQYSGGGETISDIEGIIEQLEERGEEDDFILYTSAWHTNRSVDAFKKALGRKSYILRPLVVKEEIPCGPSFKIRESILGVIMKLDQMDERRLGSGFIHWLAVKQRSK